jgi:site-specific recombinase XerD
MKLREYFAGLIDYKRQCGMCPKTLNEYRIHIEGTLSNAVGDIEVAELRQIDVGKVIEAGRQHGRFGPLRGAVVFRQLLKYLKESGIKFDFDWRDVRVPPEPRKKVEWLDKEEFEQVRNSFDLNTLSGLRDRALIETLRVSGMRIGEALSLNRDDIDWVKKEAEITNGKTKDREMVYFSDESLAWVKRYLDWRNDKSPAIFASCNGRRSSACGIRRTIHNATKAAGIKKRVHPHIFRSTFGTELLQGGVDIKSVQTLMRHRSERTTLKHYIAVNKDRCKDEHQRILNTQNTKEATTFDPISFEKFKVGVLERAI